MRTSLLALAAASLCLAGCDIEDWGDSNRFKEDFHYTHNLQANGRIDLENFNGSIEVTGWDKESVEIHGTKYASNKELLDAVKIDIQSAPDTLRIRAVKPMDRRGNCGAKFVISAPRKAVLDRVVSSNGSIRLQQLEGMARLRTTNGSIRATGLSGGLDATTSNGAMELQDFRGEAVLRTSNGSIRADGVRGRFEASTSNGGIEARVVEADHPVRLTTTNGRITLTLDGWKNSDVTAATTNSSITVRLPGTVNARLKASTSNGAVTSDFDVRREGGDSKTKLEGTIGSGGPVLSLSSSNGSIRVARL